MKTLYILRHAKSSWDDPELADFDRPLNDRGRRTAPFMGEVMQRRDFNPAIILSSPAVRASETARLVTEHGGLGAEIVHNELIYEASQHTLMQITAGLSDKFESAMIVGHNPGMEGFVRLLTKKLKPMPTAALAVIDLEIAKWADIGADSGKLREMILPKEEMKSFGKSG